MQIFADRIEFCWIHLRGIAHWRTLMGIRWSGHPSLAQCVGYRNTASSRCSWSLESVKESGNIRLAFDHIPLWRFVRILTLLGFIQVTRSSLHLRRLSDSDYNMLRTTAINVIRHLGVVGECNIQYRRYRNVRLRMSYCRRVLDQKTGH